MTRTLLTCVALLAGATALAAPPNAAMNPGGTAAVGAPGAADTAMMDAGAAAMPSSPPDLTAAPAAAVPAGLKTASVTDVKLVNELHASNLAEIQEGTMANTRAHSPKVKKYGEMLVKDHTEADKLVTAQATRLGITLSDTLPADQQTEVDALKAASDAHFDKNFVQAEASGHDKVIADVEAAQKSLTDKGVKKLTNTLLPKLRKHAKTAQRLNKEMTSAS